MDWTRKAAALGAAWAITCTAFAAPALDGKFLREQPSADAREMVQWVLDTRDAADKPFLVVDKKAARLFVFEPSGKLRSATPVILGAARGDHSVPGVGERAQSGSLPLAERTTPAGRFDTEPGVNASGERVVWFDYEAALAIHRVRPGRSHDLRTARLAASAPQQRRLSLGCVVVPVAFYTGVIEPIFGQRAGVVYVLPETQSTQQLLERLGSA